MAYFSYLIKTIIRRLVYLLINKKTLKVILSLFILFILVFLYVKPSFAIETTSTTPIVTIDYNQFLRDGFRDSSRKLIDEINYISNSKNWVGGDYGFLLSLFRDNYAVYYSVVNGENIVYFYKYWDSPSFKKTSVTFDRVTYPFYELEYYQKWTNYNWHFATGSTVGTPHFDGNGATERYNLVSDVIIDSYVVPNTSIPIMFKFRRTAANQITYSFDRNVEGDLTIPAPLMNYRDDIISDFFNLSQGNKDASTTFITDSLDKNTDKIDSTIKDSTDKILDNTVNNDSMTVDTTDYDVSSEEQEIDSFLTDLLNNIKNVFLSISSSVKTIDIGLPYVDKKITLRSDIISKHINGTFLFTLIQTFWYFVFGKHIIMFCKRMLDWLSTGEIAEKGASSFIKYLDQNNEVLKTYMM